jgi:dUTP pyrophosphatase
MQPGEPLPIPVTILPHGQGLELPAPATAGAVGLDLRAAVTEPLVIPPGGRALVPTGLAVAVPEGWEAQVRPRSGLAARHGLTLLNTPGTIDADYRGEIRVIVVNLGEEAFRVERGLRIAQLVLCPVGRPTLVPVPALPPTGRGTGGFGSTGTV